MEIGKMAQFVLSKLRTKTTKVLNLRTFCVDVKNGQLIPLNISRYPLKNNQGRNVLLTRNELNLLIIRLTVFILPYDK